MYTFYRSIIFLILIGPAVSVAAVSPHNYYSSDHSEKLLHMVESYHLPPAREKMQHRGQLKWALGDVEFVLAYFPNHPQALSLATEITRRMGSPKEADHYYEHAVQLYPGSAQTWMLYGIQLHRTGRIKEAVEKYRKALELNDNLAEAHYNLGLALVELNQIDEARKHADKAYAMGYPLPGLRDQLKAKSH